MVDRNQLTGIRRKAQNYLIEHTFQREQNRQIIGQFCIMLATTEGIANPERFCDSGHGVIESLQTGLTPRFER